MNVFIIVISALFGMFATINLFYECLRLTSNFIQTHKFSTRVTLCITISASFIAHALSIIVYTIIYWYLIHLFSFSGIEGNIEEQFQTYLYFSATTYSSLGIGDVFPIESLRLLAGIEAINGLILITWSAAFSYFEIQKIREKKLLARPKQK